MEQIVIKNFIKMYHKIPPEPDSEKEIIVFDNNHQPCDWERKVAESFDVFNDKQKYKNVVFK